MDGWNKVKSNVEHNSGNEIGLQQGQEHYKYFWLMNHGSFENW